MDLGDRGAQDRQEIMQPGQEIVASPAPVFRTPISPCEELTVPGLRLRKAPFGPRSLLVEVSCGFRGAKIPVDVHGYEEGQIEGIRGTFVVFFGSFDMLFPSCWNV
jgi:hypothetical protein